MNLFDKIFDLVAWIKIFFSPTLVGLIIGAYLRLSNENNDLMQIVALGVVAIGITSGIIWAERVRKKQGTQEFVSTIYRTPELEKEQDSK